MHIFWIVVMGAVAVAWVASAVDLALGVRTIPWLRDLAPLEDDQCPAVSILFAGRDEAEKMPGAIATMLALDYPRYEVIAVDDRSVDATGAILAAGARKDARLKPARVDSLPAGWLGKPHALEKAYERSGGEWLVFTDADVHFKPDVLRHVIALAERMQWDHLTLLAAPKLYTFGEKVAMMFFSTCFLIGTRPWRANNPKSRGYSGIGAFQLVRRSAYEKAGTHRRLAMEVIDDLKLGKIVKEAGFRSGVARGEDAVSVHWHAGLANIVRGTTKNFFAATGFSLPVLASQVLATLAMFVLPVAALVFVRGWALVFAAAAAILALVIAAGAARAIGASPFYALTYPVGALIICWMLLRSTAVTLWQGGVTWRGTFYPIDELKRGVV
ncbi:MAG: glycosyltransferase [Candidatus Acidiferrales bacterium]